jgi:hypothetical protein
MPPADLNGLVLFAERRNLVFCACAVTFQLVSTELLTRVHCVVAFAVALPRNNLLNWVSRDSSGGVVTGLPDG